MSQLNLAPFNPAQGNMFGREPSSGARARKAAAKVVRGGKAIRIGDYAEFQKRPGSLRLDAMTDKDWAAQTKALLRVYGHTGTAVFSRKISEETLRNRTDILFSTLRLLMDDCKQLRTLSQIRPRLIPRMLQLWDSKGVSDLAKINYYTNMRWYWRLFGIDTPPISHFATYPGQYTIGRAAEKDKSWAGNGVSFEEVLKQIHDYDPVAARLFVSMKTFGLRAKESLRLEPHEADGGDALLVRKGSKTGRPRDIKFKVFGEEALRETLDELKGQVPEKCHQAWANITLKKAKHRLYYICRKFGLTKKDLGVTMHGLRHEWAIDQLYRMANVTAPVRGGMTLNYRKLSEVRMLISEGLGHSRIEITTAYYGSFLTMERQRVRRFEASWIKIESVMPAISQLLVKAGLDNLYWVGKRSAGANGSTDPYEFLLPPLTDSELALHLAPLIADLIIGATGQECSVGLFEANPESRRQLWFTEAVPMMRGIAPGRLSIPAPVMHSGGLTESAYAALASDSEEQEPDFLF